MDNTALKLQIVAPLPPALLSDAHIITTSEFNVSDEKRGMSRPNSSSK
jgi:hypothetical protein